MIEIKRNTPQPTQKCAEMPVLAPGREQAIKKPEAQTALKRPLKPFVAFDSRNYRAANRAVCDFHERHNPPRLDDDNGLKYWEETTDDMTAVANAFDNDPFLTGLIMAVFDELEREYRALKEAAVKPLEGR